MKTYKQFIREQEELEESRLKKLALGLGVAATLGAAAVGLASKGSGSMKEPQKVTRSAEDRWADEQERRQNAANAQISTSENEVARTSTGVGYKGGPGMKSKTPVTTKNTTPPKKATGVVSGAGGGGLDEE